MNKVLTAGAVALALVAGGAWYMTQGTPVGSTGFDLPGAAQAQGQDGEIDTSGVIEMALGDPDAPIEVIEYASYTCPHCATAHLNLMPRIKEDYVETGKVRLLYREVYFDKYGMWASMVARCGGPERFFGITDLIYKGQGDILAPARRGNDAAAAEELRKIGRLAGLDNATLDACLNDGDKLRALLAWFQQNAAEHGIEATPSFVIDGQTYSNMSYDAFSEILDEKLGE
jgi:protein-disulfide isomerase